MGRKTAAHFFFKTQKGITGFSAIDHPRSHSLSPSRGHRFVGMMSSPRILPKQAAKSENGCGAFVIWVTRPSAEQEQHCLPEFPSQERHPDSWACSA
jgi:hypothetical protein